MVQNPIRLLNSNIGKRVGVFLGALILTAVAVGAFMYGDRRRQAQTNQPTQAEPTIAQNNTENPTGSESPPLPGSNNSPATPNQGQPTPAPRNNENPASQGSSNSNNRSNDEQGNLAETGPEDTAALITTILVLLATKYFRGRRELRSHG